jgi:succinate dehydrogenase flavin-adding protein (antitoxin of CptAB toxin-antitoxin module)
MSVREEFNRMVLDLVDWFESEVERLTEHLKDKEGYIFDITDEELAEWIAKRKNAGS